MDMRRDRPRIPIGLVLIFIILSLIIILSGYLYRSNYKKTISARLQDELISICSLKVKQIVDWRKERYGDALYVFHNILLKDKIHAFLKDPSQQAGRQEIRLWLTQTRNIYDYGEVAVFGPDGMILLSSEDSSSYDQSEVQLALSSLEKRQVVFGDLQRHGETGKAHIGLSVPVLVSVSGQETPAGGIMFLIYADRFLYPMIQSWPVPSETAETLLLTRDGNDVMYLNELRHRKNTALLLRLSLASSTLPAAKAAKGEHGVIEGLDYRGVPVISFNMKIPDTSWVLLAKMDLSEAFAPVRAADRMLSLFMLVSIVAAGGGIGFYRRHKMAAYYRSLYRTQEELRKNEDRLETLFRLSMMQADTETRIVDFALEEAVRLTSSKGGYLHFFNEDEQTVQLYSWSKDVLKICDAEKDEHYPFDRAGIWADSVRLRRPVIHNDYQHLQDKKGYPEGHFHLVRHLGVPILDGDRIVGVAGVGNKEQPYTQADSLQTSLFMNSMWGILKRKKTEEERERLIAELKKALAEVKTLSGLLPICASCKRIRDDKGYWNQIESYIKENTEAEFTHGICPDCVKQLYPECSDLVEGQDGPL